ncbi:helix-turn-helix transcriptional regulator [Streptomyces sp. CAU 1734]|uniref:AraC family transcriptional regulator n=1 Tax=Streptomyces sp. CAU 1734 TaxID=3140360 RepID=UPI003260B21B
MLRNGHAPRCGGGPGTAIVVSAFTLSDGFWSATRSHPCHRLARSGKGLLAVRTGARAWLLPPSMALWIPARLPHATGAAGSADVHGARLDPAGCAGAPDEPTVVAAGPLLSALIGHLDRPDLGREARRRAEAVVLDVLEPLPVTSVSVPEPVDPRALAVARALAADPRDNRGLEAWGDRAGTSARTLARLFIAETGLTFGQWRERLRMQAAMPLLAGDLPIEAVARRVGYGSASSFVAAFHRIVGLTPRQYFP